MKKLLLLSLMAIVPCAMVAKTDNATAPQLSGPQTTPTSPMQPYMGMNDTAGMSCPTDEEFAAMVQQIQDEFNAMSPEDRAKLEQEMMDGFAQAYEQMTPEQRAELDETMGLIAMQELEQMGEEILKTPEGQAFAQGVQAGAELGAAAKEQEIIQEAEAILPVLQDAIIKEEAEIAKNCPYAPAVK